MKQLTIEHLMPIASIYLRGTEGVLFVETIRKLGYNDLKEFLHIEYLDGTGIQDREEALIMLKESVSKILSRTETERKKAIYADIDSKYNALSDYEKINVSNIRQRLNRLVFEEMLSLMPTREAKEWLKHWSVNRLEEILRIYGASPFLQEYIDYLKSVPIVSYEIESSEKDSSHISSTFNPKTKSQFP